MRHKGWKIFGIVVVVIIAVLGGSYWHLTHSVTTKVPGNTYRYQSVSKDKTLYVTFAQTGDRVVVNQNKTTAVNAAASQSNFDKAYSAQSKSATWNYKADVGTLTLAEKTSDNKISQWQYNKVLAMNSKLISFSFTYQIAKAGQGQVKNRTTFDKIN